jgi:hypothetical protein
MKMLRLTILFLLIGGGAISAVAQTRSKTYLETRKLLLKMERAHEDRVLKKLFEETGSRKSDLIQALYDPEQKVSLNAQVVIRYLAEPRMLSAVEEWYEYRRRRGKDYWMPKIELLSEVKYLEGKGRDLAKLVLKNLRPNEKDVRAKVVAFNKGQKTALIEVVLGAAPGNVFTEGWHVVVRQENGKWRLLSNSLVWQS